jgi:hypothetical protein
MCAYENQEKDWTRLGRWKTDELPVMNGQNSVEQLLKVVQDKLNQNQKID